MHGMHEAAGSNPAGSKNYFIFYNLKIQHSKIAKALGVLIDDLIKWNHATN